MINQHEFIRQFNDEYREDFNDVLFSHTDEDIVEEIKKVILSCQRNRVFTINVRNFTVVKDYAEIQRILRDFEKDRLKNRPTEDNRYDFINLKDSDIQLLIVDYYIAIHNPEVKESMRHKNLRVLISLPRVVEKYYYRLSGNLYSPIYQIIESTYNNSSSNSKSSMVVLKTMFMASRFYRYKIENSKEMRLKSTDGTYMTGVYYQSRIFSKMVPAMKYLLARYGFYGLMHMMKTPHIQLLTEDPLIPSNYTINRHNVYVSVPKFIYDNDQTVQSLVYTICGCINKDTTVERMFTNNFWLESLGESFSPKALDKVDKGLAILESLESIYDIPAKDHLHLPEEDKEDIYKVLIWIVREYAALRLKDNLDISMKRIRCAEYIAALYALKISRRIFKASDKGNKATLSDIEKALITYPDFLLKTITKDRLINCRNSVNDLDSMNALKYTYKGVSGLGEKGTSIPQQYRQVHKSHIGRLDMDSVTSTDPGLTGILCPMGDNYNGSFSQNPEPNTWREDTDAILNEYDKLIGMRCQLMNKIKTGESTKDDTDQLEVIEDTMSSLSYLMRPIYSVDTSVEDMANSLTHI